MNVTFDMQNCEKTLKNEGERGGISDFFCTFAQSCCMLMEFLYFATTKMAT